MRKGKKKRVDVGYGFYVGAILYYILRSYIIFFHLQVEMQPVYRCIDYGKKKKEKPVRWQGYLTTVRGAHALPGV